MKILKIKLLQEGKFRNPDDIYWYFKNVLFKNPDWPKRVASFMESDTRNPNLMSKWERFFKKRFGEFVRDFTPEEKETFFKALLCGIHYRRNTLSKGTYMNKKRTKSHLYSDISERTDVENFLEKIVRQHFSDLIDKDYVPDWLYKRIKGERKNKIEATRNLINVCKSLKIEI